MSLFSRFFTRQLLTQPRLNRNLSIAASKTSNDKNNQNSQRWNSNKTLAISCAGVVSFALLKDYLGLPKVSAATALPSRRTQFNFIADVVETAAQSLVYIEIQDTRRIDYSTGKPVTVSNGSGFLVETNGLILTNAHVVINKPRSIVSVRLSDGRVFQGIVEAVDPVSDLATVRIQCKNLPAMKLGQSSSLRAGEFVIALGSPLCKLNIINSSSINCHLTVFHYSS
jgi:S1-C subfamily serine protease